MRESRTKPYRPAPSTSLPSLDGGRNLVGDTGMVSWTGIETSAWWRTSRGMGVEVGTLQDRGLYASFAGA